MTLEEKALVAALELLRLRLGDNTVALAANTKRTEDEFKEQAQGIRTYIDSKLGTPATPGWSPGGTPPGATPGVPPPAPNVPKEVRAPAEAGGGRGGGGAAANPLYRVMGEVVGKFAAIIGPAAILGAVLSNSLSGFQILTTAVRVLATTLAPILLPVVVALSVGMLAISDVLTEHLLPAMEGWFTFILANAIPAIEFFAEILDSAAQHVEEIADAFDGAGAAILEFTANAYRQANRLDPTSSTEEDEEYIRKHITGEGGEEGGGGPEVSGRTKDSVGAGLRDTLKSLRLSIGPKAQISGLGDVGKQVQQAALNNDPLEARMLKVQQDMLARLEKIAANTERDRLKRAYDRMYGDELDPFKTGSGDYEGGTGGHASSGDYGG